MSDKRCECCYCLARRGLSHEESDWIKVQDQLPPERYHVLVCDNWCGPHYIQSDRSYSIRVAFRQNNSWYCHLDEGLICSDDILERIRSHWSEINYWRPLPVPPPPYAPQRISEILQSKAAPIDSHKWHDYYEWPSKEELKHLILNSPYIGLGKAISTKGKKTYIDEKMFFDWVVNHPEYKDKLDKMNLTKKKVINCFE